MPPATARRHFFSKPGKSGAIVRRRCRLLDLRNRPGTPAAIGWTGRHRASSRMLGRGARVEGGAESPLRGGNSERRSAENRINDLRDPHEQRDQTAQQPRTIFVLAVPVVADE